MLLQNHTSFQRLVKENHQCRQFWFLPDEIGVFLINNISIGTTSQKIPEFIHLAWTNRFITTLLHKTLPCPRSQRIRIFNTDIVARFNELIQILQHSNQVRVRGFHHEPRMMQILLNNVTSLEKLLLTI